MIIYIYIHTNSNETNNKSNNVHLYSLKSIAQGLEVVFMLALLVAFWGPQLVASIKFSH